MLVVRANTGRAQSYPRLQVGCTAEKRRPPLRHASERPRLQAHDHIDDTGLRRSVACLQVKAYRFREAKPDQLLGAAIISLSDLPSDGRVQVLEVLHTFVAFSSMQAAVQKREALHLPRVFAGRPSSANTQRALRHSRNVLRTCADGNTSAECCRRPSC